MCCCGRNNDLCNNYTIPAATISYAGTPFCKSLAGSVSVTRIGTAGGTYTSSPAGLTIDGTTGAITPGSSTAGTYTVTYTLAAAGGCSLVTATTSVTITAVPTATISYATPLCTSLSTPQAVTLTGTGAYTGGTFSSTAGLTIDASTGAITPGTSTPGTYTVTYVIPASGGCASVGGITTTVTITLFRQPQSAMHRILHINSTPQAVTLNGTGAYTGGTFSSTAGLTIDASTGAITPSTSTPGNYTVTYVIPASAVCSIRWITTSVKITLMPAATISYAGTPFCRGLSEHKP